MKILLTTTSFQDTPGAHHELLKQTGWEIITARGPLNEADTLALVGDVDGYICGDDAITRKVLEKARPKLKVLSKYGIGVDKIDVKSCTEFGIPLLFTPGVNHTTVAEHTFLLLLSLEKNLLYHTDSTRSGGWKRKTGHELLEKTIGIIGLGRIGKEVAIRAKAFGMNVIGITSRTSVPNFDKLMPREQLKEAASLADFLIAVLPLTPETRGIIDGAVLDAMPRHGVFINIARGPVVKEDELIDRLQRKVIAGAGLDTFVEEPLPATSPLWSMENVIITPHIGGKSESYVDQILPLIAHNLRAFQEGRLQDFKNRVER